MIMINIKETLRQAKDFDNTLNLSYIHLIQLIRAEVIDKDNNLYYSILITGLLLGQGYTYQDIKIAKDYWKDGELPQEVLWGFFEMIGAKTPLENNQKRIQAIRRAICIEKYGLCMEVLKRSGLNHLWGKRVIYGTNYKYEVKNNKLYISYFNIKEYKKNEMFSKQIYLKAEALDKIQREVFL